MLLLQNPVGQRTDWQHDDVVGGTLAQARELTPLNAARQADAPLSCRTRCIIESKHHESYRYRHSN